MVAEFFSSLKDNPYFGAGFGLVGVGTGLAILRKLGQYGFVIFRRRYVMTLEVPSKDKSYYWLLRWITSENHKYQHISVDTKIKQLNNGKITSEFKFIPSLGNHFFLYKNTWIRMERSRESNVVDLNTGTPWESITLSTLGRKPHLFRQMLEEAKQKVLKSNEGLTILYTALGTEWRQFGLPKRKRPLQSVVLDKELSSNIVKDINEFIQNPGWYLERGFIPLYINFGIPYRRGYLLYGPPGCGKSSFIQALAGDIGFNICILNLGERGLTDDRLVHLLSIAPEQSIILLEDIDAVFDLNEDSHIVSKRYDGLTRVTFSGLLNALDGVVASEARILFMTTNYYDRLDPALIRPGRVDYKQYVGYATDYQIQEMFKKFYPTTGSVNETVSPLTFLNALLKYLGKKEKAIEISPAQLQGYFMMFKDDPREAINNISSYIDKIL